MATLPPLGFFPSSTTLALSTLQKPQPCFLLPKPFQVKLPFPFVSNTAIYSCHFSWWVNEQQQQKQQFCCSSSQDSSSATTIATAEATQSPVENRTRLIAQNIPWTSTAEDIRSLFQKHGTVVDVELSMYNSTTNRGLAFITMGSEEEASAALNGLNSYELGGRIIKVEFARSVKKKPNPVRAEPATKYNVFVGNLAWGVKSRDLREFFGASNPNILSAEVIFQNNPRRPAGYGFVSFGSKEAAEAAIAAFNGKKLMGRAVRLVYGKHPPADSKEEAS